MENSLLVCDKCDKFITKKTKFIKVKTDFNDYLFCKPCVKEAFHILLMKPDKNVEETKLMRQFNKYLKKDFN